LRLETLTGLEDERSDHKDSYSVDTVGEVVSIRATLTFLSV